MKKRKDDDQKIIENSHSNSELLEFESHNRLKLHAYMGDKKLAKEI